MIPNISLNKTNENNFNQNISNEKFFGFDNYQILINFDMSEIPGWIRYFKAIDNENISWIMRVHTTDPIKFYIDTTKEDKENKLKEAWENIEPGRSDKAKFTRKKFLIMKKREIGEDITLEEEEILNTKPRKKPKIKIEVVTEMKNTFDNTEINDNKNKKPSLNQQIVTKKNETTLTKNSSSFSILILIIKILYLIKLIQKYFI